MSEHNAQRELCLTCHANARAAATAAPLASGEGAYEADPSTFHMQRMLLMGAVASGFVHDLNNLLTVVAGVTSLAEEELPADHPCRTSLVAVQRASRSASMIARRMLDFVRHRPSQRRVIELRGFIQEYLPLAARLVGPRVSITASLAPELWPIYADPVQIEQLLLNLLVNARDAIPAAGAVTITAANAPAAGAPPGLSGDYVCLTVADTGAGISPEISCRLFEPFVSGGASDGAGLGLAICHCIVCQLGGAIEVESAPGGGALFRIYLPRPAGGSDSGPFQGAA